VAKMEQVEQKFPCPLIELWGMTEIADVKDPTKTFDTDEVTRPRSNA
jgi:hypothetical protein